MSREVNGDHEPVAPDPGLMADARARGMARWQAPAVIETATPTPGEQRSFLKPRLAAIGLAIVVVVAALLINNSLRGEPTAQPDPTRPGGGYLPGVITPPEEPSSSSPAPMSTTTTTTTTTTAPVAHVPGVVAPVKYSGTAGPDCGGFTGVGSYRDGREGWVDHGDGCGSAFVSIPMSGDRNKDDTSAYGRWNFTTAPVTAGSCTLSVFVPNGSLEQVGGNPTTYRVYDGADVSGAQLASFVIKQVDQRGKWVGAGTFRVSTGRLTVQLLTRGQDWNGSGPTYAHHAAAAIKADCTA